MKKTIKTLLGGLALLATIIVVPNVEAQTDLSDGLVACYPFNGNANDESGNGLNGTVTGATLTTDRFGNANSAYAFDGIDDQIRVLNDPALNGMTEMTLVAWTKIIGWGGPFISKDRLGDYQYNLSGGDRAGVTAWFYAGAEHLGADSSRYINDGNWHLIVGILKNNEKAEIYIDGVLDRTAYPSSWPWNLSGSGDLCMGRRCDLKYPLNGLIDDVRIYNRALNQDEINQLFNTPPVAHAGGNKSVLVGDTVELDGTGSTDADGDPLTFNWSFVLKPAESTAMLSGETTPTASFIADVSGTYDINLTVNDGIIDSDPDSASILALTVLNAMTLVLDEATIVINNIPPTDLKNPKMANALTKKINAVLKMIEKEQYQKALDKLTNDILAKTDGCANGGEPDRNDWIRTCVEQDEVHTLITDAISIVSSQL